MAERRMFAKTIIDSDQFLDMPLSSQCLYFHLSMRADDDGFINNPKRIQRMIGSSDDDLKLLIAKQFIIPFESGIVVIKHWKIHNYIQKDRYKETIYKEEKSQLLETDKTYEKQCIQDVYIPYTQYSIELDKNSIEKDKDSIDKDKEINDVVIQVVEYLNLKANTNYRTNSKGTLKELRARIKDGLTLEECKYIIDVKCNDWLNTDNEKHLNPTTLFRSSNYERYLNQKMYVKNQQQYNFEESERAF